jgi:hypothetical protein
MAMNAPFMPGRIKPRLQSPNYPAVTLTDRDALRAIAQDADLLGETYLGERWMLVKVPREVFALLIQLDAEIADMEPDQDEGGTEDGRDPEAEDGDEDREWQDEVLAVNTPRVRRLRRRWLKRQFNEDDEQDGTAGL